MGGLKMQSECVARARAVPRRGGGRVCAAAMRVACVVVNGACVGGGGGGGNGAGQGGGGGGGGLGIMNTIEACERIKEEYNFIQTQNRQYMYISSQNERGRSKK